MSSNKYPRIPSLIIAELLKNNQTLNVVKLIEGILPSLQANYSLITLEREQTFPSCELMYLYIGPHVTNMLNRNEVPDSFDHT